MSHLSACRTRSVISRNIQRPTLTLDPVSAQLNSERRISGSKRRTPHPAPQFIARLDNHEIIEALLVESTCSNRSG